MDAGAPRLGVRMTPEEARNFVNQLNAEVLRRWDERVSQGEFMKRLTEGRLPLSAIQTFFRNWGNFTVEINTLIAASYHRHIGFFKRHSDLLAPFGAKVADEFIHKTMRLSRRTRPRPPCSIPAPTSISPRFSF